MRICSEALEDLVVLLHLVGCARTRDESTNEAGGGGVPLPLASRKRCHESRRARTSPPPPRPPPRPPVACTPTSPIPMACTLEGPQT